MNQEIISKTIKDIRTKNKLTQEEFGNLFGVTYQAVSKWENGKSIPDIDTLTNICKKYNIDINTLLITKKKSTKNKIIIITLIVATILSFMVILFMNKTSDYQVKEINSTCEMYDITGTAVISNDRATLTIPKINYCGEDEFVYEKIEVKLIKEDGNVLTIIDQTSGSNTTIKDFLKNVKFHIDEKTNDCNYFKDSKLSIEIKTDNKVGGMDSHVIPLTLNETTCTK